MHIFHLISRLGDLLVLLPASLMLIALLMRMGARGDALAYGKALFFCLAAMFAMKFALATCGRASPRFGLSSPSGHVAFAATFYGCLALWLTTARPWTQRLAVGAAVVALVAVIALARVRTLAHTPPETWVGGATGLASVALFGFARPRPVGALPPLPRAIELVPIVAIYTLCLLLAANQWTAESWIDALAMKFASLSRICAG